MARIERSKREWIDAEGNKVERPEQATGVRYTLIGGKEGGHVYDLSHLESTLDRWCAGFGFFTKAGNEANTVMNTDKGSVEEADEAIEEMVDNWRNGIYRERQAGQGGTRVNKDALAQAVAEIMAANNKTTFSKGPPAVVGKSADQATVRQLLEEDTKGLAIRYWRQIDDVAKRYSEIAGAPRKTAADM